MTEPAALRAALWYANNWGVLVAPADPVLKKPLIRTGVDHAEHSSRDPEVIRTWEQWEHDGVRVAIVTGVKSGVLVKDIDNKPGVSGDDSLRELQDSICELPDTPTQDTKRGSQQVYRYPAGVEIRNSVSKLAPGIDVRGCGGLFIAPPAPDRRWRVDAHPTNTPLAELPRRWVDALVGLEQGSNGQKNAAIPIEIAEGAGRNSILFSLACAMRRRGLEVVEILPTLAAVNARRCKPPLDADELGRIAASACRYVPEPILRIGSDFEQAVAKEMGL